MPDRLKSRKFWVTIGCGVAMMVCKQAGIDLPEDLVKVVLTYIGGQSAVDLAKAWKG